MRCTDPRTVGFRADGKTIAWSQKNYSKEYSTFQLPCGQCLACRLDYARQWAIRCVHEASIHENNMFVTLTYDDQHLESDKLIYKHFQDFAKNLRSKIFYDSLCKAGYKESDYKNLSKQQKKLFRENKISVPQISIFVTGEYGEQKKRPHWHACIFNYSPPDPVFKYSTDRGDQVFKSETLTSLWGRGTAEYGQVTFHSAGYCARYAAKKLVHGHDDQHDFQPISKKSSKHAIGKRWLEKNWRDVFNNGELILKNPDGKYVTSSIPRYYEKWLKKHQPTEWSHYVTQTKIYNTSKIERKVHLEKLNEARVNEARRTQRGPLYTPQKTKLQHSKEILRKKFNQLQSKLKL